MLASSVNSVRSGIGLGRQTSGVGREIDFFEKGDYAMNCRFKWTPVETVNYCEAINFY